MRLPVRLACMCACSSPISGYAAEPFNTAGGGGAARYVLRDPNPSLREEPVEVPWKGSRTSVEKNPARFYRCTKPFLAVLNHIGSWDADERSGMM